MNNKIVTKITSSVLLGTMLVYTTSPVFAFTKDETVYSKIDTQGRAYSTIVNSHIINSNQEELINDVSDLLNIINTNGEETFSQNGNAIVWSAKGNDIYYQGESKKDLPIECNIKYELDGKEVSAADIIGKTGKVKITLTYTNKDSHTVKINGKDEILYTPFVVMCGTIINNENNKNITISSGKLVDDGSKTIALGISTPGLQESLNLSQSTLDIPSSIEITMDATDFELGTMVTYITPKILDNEDLSIFDEVDEIFAQVDTLQNSSHQLVEGANALKEGTTTYSEKSAEFNSAVKQVSDGITSANSSYSAIHNGIALLNQKAPTLATGAKSISDGTGALATALNTLNAKLSAMPENPQELLTSLNTLSTGISSLTPLLRSIGGDNSAKISQIDTLIAENTSRKTTLNDLNTKLAQEKANLPADQAQLADILQEQIDANNNSITTLTKNIDELSAEKAILTGLSQNNLITLANGLDGIKTGLNNLSPLVSSVYSLKPAIGQLAESATLLANGAIQVSEGADQVVGGISNLAGGSSQMKNGLNTLETGAKELYGASNQLADAANTIAEGSTTLAEGMTKFNSEGIDKICNYINGNLKDVKVRIEKLQDLSEEYNHFSMLNESDKGTVKFILITDSLSKENASSKNDEDKDEE